MSEHPKFVPLERLFQDGKPIIGVVHLLPLPGAPRFSGSFCQVLARAAEDAERLAEGGVDGILVENFGDAPFFKDEVPPETVAAMSVAVSDIARSISVPVGVNVLRNDARCAVAVAFATGAQFVRVNVHTGVVATDQGIIEGRAAQTMRLRRSLTNPSPAKEPTGNGYHIHVLADVFVKHGAPLGSSSLIQAARETAERGLADALVLTGVATGELCDRDDVLQVKDQLPDVRVLVGSGVTAENIHDYLEIADGVIVGTSFKQDGIVTNPVDTGRVRRLMEGARG